MRLFFELTLFLSSFAQNLYGLGMSNQLQKSKIVNKPPVLLLHGLISSKETWEPIIKRLQDEFGDVWSLDLPGYGDSYRVPYKTLKEVKDALNQFVQEHKIKDPIVIAHSMAAQLSVLCYDILKPSVLIIEDMDMQQRTRPEKAKFQLFESGFATRSELLKALEKGDYYKSTIEMIDSQFVVKEKDRFFAKINPYTDSHYRENVLSNAEVKNAWKVLPKDLPILVLQASKGSATSEHGVRFMKDYHAKIEFKKIPESEHSIHGSRSTEFLSAIKSFLNTLKK